MCSASWYIGLRNNSTQLQGWGEYQIYEYEYKYEYL